MLRYVLAALGLAAISLAQDAPNLAGTWSFTSDDGSSGTIVLHQSGVEFSGAWHTSGSKADSDTLIAAKLYGNTMLLTRAVDDSQQTYILTLSADGKRLEGSGQGSLNHAKLTMQLLSAAPNIKHSSRGSRPARPSGCPPGTVRLRHCWSSLPRFDWALQVRSNCGSWPGTRTATCAT